MALVYALCTNKKATAYSTILNQVKAKSPALNPPQINIDFELATLKAIKEVFPNTKVQGCIFHFFQSLVRNLAQHGLKSRYETDVRFAFEIRQIMALAFLPVEEVVGFSPS